MNISIVIVTYNSHNLIIDCLESIFKYNTIGENLEVIVVDNSSSEQEKMFSDISNRYGGRVVLIDSGKNGGYGFGNNIGISRSHSDIVIVMNPDVRFVCPILDRILTVFMDNEIAMGGVNFIDGSCPYYFKRGYNSLFHNLFFKLYLKKKKYESDTMFLSGSFLIFRKTDFLIAGAFDENIFMYSEEADITNRILAINKKVVWLSDIYVLHLAHGRAFNSKLNKIRLESGLYYENKYGINIRRSYRNELITLKINYYLSKLLFKKEKTILYSEEIKQLVDFYRNI